MKKSWILLILIISAVSGCTDLNVVMHANHLKGREASAEGKYSEAVSYHKRVAELDPQNGDWFRFLSVAYYKNDQYQEAVDAGKKALNLPHNKELEYETWKNMGLAYNKLGQIDSAIASQKRSIALTPDNSDSFVTLAYLYSKNKQYDEAITAAKRAIELKSDNAVAYYNLGVAYGMKKQYSEAIKALQKAIEINPKDAVAYGWMGRFLMEKNAYNEAAEAYKKGIEAAPTNPNLREALSVAYYRMGRYDDALASANKAIELKTYTGVGIQNGYKDAYPIVKVVTNMGPAKKADVQVGDKIIEIDGKSTEGWNDEKLVQSVKGTVGTQVVLTIERNDNKIKKTVAREKIVPEGAASSIGIRSLIYRHKGDLDKAFSDAGMASTLNPSDYYARLSLGAAYLDRGQYDESIKLLAQVKDSPTASLLEATTFAKQGKMKLAVNFYSDIMNTYSEEKLSPKNVPQMHNRMVLLQTFKPIVKEHRDKARSLESKGQYKEALAELSEALKTADDTETQAIQETTFSMLRRNPLLSQVPEDARKYALRSEMLVKEGNFEQAATELKKAIQIAPYAARLYYNSALINAELKKYPEAIRHMKIYLKAAPDAPDARAAKDEIIKWEFMMEKEGR